MTQITNKLEKIRKKLSVKDKKEEEEKNIKAKRFEKNEMFRDEKLKEGISIITEEFTPLFSQIYSEVYESSTFKEIKRFWSGFPTDFVYESSGWKKNGSSYIPLYKKSFPHNYFDFWGGNRIYLVEKGFRFELDFYGVNSPNGWNGYVEDIQKNSLIKRYLRVTSTSIADFLGKYSPEGGDGRFFVFESNDKDLFLKKISPFLLSDSLTRFGVFEDLLDVSVKEIKKRAFITTKESQEKYESRITELFKYIDYRISHH